MSAPLTDFERQIAVLTCDGVSRREMGKRLSLPARRAETVYQSLLNKTGCRTIPDVVRWAIRCGLYPFPSV